MGSVLEVIAMDKSCEAVADLASQGTLELLSAGDVVLASVDLTQNAFGVPVNGVATADGDDGMTPISALNPLTLIGAAAAGAGTLIAKHRYRDKFGDVFLTTDGAAIVGDSSQALILTSLLIQTGTEVAIIGLTITQIGS